MVGDSLAPGGVIRFPTCTRSAQLPATPRQSPASARPRRARPVCTRSTTTPETHTPSARRIGDRRRPARMFITAETSYLTGGSDAHRSVGRGIKPTPWNREEDHGQELEGEGEPSLRKNPAPAGCCREGTPACLIGKNDNGAPPGRPLSDTSDSNRDLDLVRGSQSAAYPGRSNSPDTHGWRPRCWREPPLRSSHR